MAFIGVGVDDDDDDDVMPLTSIASVRWNVGDTRLRLLRSKLASHIISFGIGDHRDHWLRCLIEVFVLAMR